MLKELTKYSSFGRREDYKFLFENVLSEKPIKEHNIKHYCLGNKNYYLIPVEAIISLLKDLNILNFVNGQIYLNEKGLDFKRRFITEESTNVFVYLLIEKYFLEIVNIESLKFDYIVDAYYIRNSDISLHYSGIRNLLINLGFIGYVWNNNLLYISKEYQKELVEMIKKERKQISLEKFKKIQEQKELFGAEAEDFVLEYEKKRLRNLGRKDIKTIKKISELDVGAGYDIVSFVDLNSTSFDKFIEVKSYDTIPNFFWSVNEVNTSIKKGENYFLYLVDRSKVSNSEYNPIIIGNPHKNVFLKEKWSREAQSWHFTLNEDFI